MTRKIIKPYKTMQDMLRRVGLIAPGTEFNRRAAEYAEQTKGQNKSREFQRAKARRKKVSDNP